LGGVVLDLLQLIELESGIGDGENVAGPGVFVDEKAPVIRVDLLFNFQDAFAFQHHGQDVADGVILGVLGFNQGTEEGFGGLLLNGINGGGGRGVIDALPLGDEAFAFAGAIAELGLPASGADIEALVLLFVLKEQGMVGLKVRKGPFALLADPRARLNIPLVHHLLAPLSPWRPQHQFFIPALEP
jgi:hypothetical protein